MTTELDGLLERLEGAAKVFRDTAESTAAGLGYRTLADVRDIHADALADLAEGVVALVRSMIDGAKP